MHEAIKEEKEAMDPLSIMAMKILGFVSRDRELINPNNEKKVPATASEMKISPDELRALIKFLMASPEEWNALDSKIQNAVPLKALKYYKANNPALNTFKLSLYLGCTEKKVKDLLKSL